MFSEELKQGTAVAHLDLERKMIPLLKKIGSKMDYIRLLNYMLGYYQPLELRLATWMGGYDLQSHAANIRKDIDLLDPEFTVGAAETQELPIVDSAEKALGILYVMEGSTLGGQIITKMLLNQLKDGTTAAFNFYNPYGEKTMEKWKPFRQRLDQPFNEEQKQAIVAGANETFNSLNSWISSYESNSKQQI